MLNHIDVVYTFTDPVSYQCLHMLIYCGCAIGQLNLIVKKFVKVFSIFM